MCVYVCIQRFLTELGDDLALGKYFSISRPLMYSREALIVTST